MLTPLQKLTPRQLFQELIPRLLDDKLPTTGVGRVEFRIDGPEGGNWLVDFDARTVGAGGAKPHVIVAAATLDFMALVDGTMTPADGLLTERLKLTGDVARIDRLTGLLAQLRELVAKNEGAKS